MRVETVVDCRCDVGEGPFWDDRDGSLWWVDIVAKAVYRWVGGDEGPQRWSVPDFPSAVFPWERGGTLLAMRDGVYSFDPAGNGGGASLRLVARLEPDRPGNRSNDAKCDPEGRLWVGTMQNNLHPDGSDKEMTESTGALYCLHHDRSVTRAVDGIGLSNTLAWSADGRTLYFGDTLADTIWAFAFDPDSGEVGERRVFASGTLPGACDGSTIDAEGYLWNARFGGGCLVRLAPDGRVDRVVELPVTNPTSCCFGGPDLATLYVTSARHGLSPDQIARAPQEGSVLALDAEVAGTPSIRCRLKG